jgi:Arc/MetJ-type ribon-helix-helix transcriptional regulator
MNLELKQPELERYLDEQVRAGHFPTREAVVEYALKRVMEEQVELTEEDLADIAISDEQFARGEYVEWDDFAGRMRKKYGIS